jgi:hypothetical protein
MSTKSFAIVACGGALALFVSGCGDRPAGPPVEPDCNAGAGYDLSKVIVNGSLLTAGEVNGTTPKLSLGFDYGDCTPGAHRIWTEQAVDGSATCGDMHIVDMKDSGQNDYGGAFFVLTGGLDLSAFDGLFFWAKAPLANSTNSLTLLLADRNNFDLGGVCFDAPSPPDTLINTAPTCMADPLGDNVITPNSGAGTAMGMSTAGVVVAQQGTGATGVPNYEPPPGSCGNLFQYPFQFTTEWQLYLLPWNLFFQSQQPNRNPNGIDPSELYEVGFQIPKEAHFEMWIDQLGAYKLESAPAGP